MLIESENTYITVSDAEIYVRDHYPKYAPLRVIWNVLEDEEKESYLRNSLTELERLMYVGRKKNAIQCLQFPRLREASGGFSYPYSAYFGVGDINVKIPEEVKNAQIENALAILQKECMAQTDKQFMIMQSLGVMKNIKYNKREAGDVGMGDDIKGGSSQSTGLTGKAAEAMLRGWFGSFRL